MVRVRVGTVVLNALGAMMEGGCAVLARLFRPFWHVVVGVVVRQ